MCALLTWWALWSWWCVLSWSPGRFGVWLSGSFRPRVMGFWGALTYVVIRVFIGCLHCLIGFVSGGFLFIVTFSLLAFCCGGGGCGFRIIRCIGQPLFMEEFAFTSSVAFSSGIVPASYRYFGSWQVLRVIRVLCSEVLFHVMFLHDILYILHDHFRYLAVPLAVPVTVNFLSFLSDLWVFPHCVGTSLGVHLVSCGSLLQVVGST